MMLHRLAATALVLGALAGPAAAEVDADLLAELIASDARPEGHVARDEYRKPAEVLTFFGISPDMEVVEIWPSGGYYTNILAPYLASGEGTYFAAGFPRTSKSEFAQRSRARWAEFLESDPERFGEIVTTGFGKVGEDEDWALTDGQSVDAILTFRNLHNFMSIGWIDEAFETFYANLKPGGILGIVEHEAPEDGAQDPKAESGYVQRAWTVAKAVEHGFEYVSASEVLHNPADRKDYPDGVWTLPPTLRTKVDGCTGETFAEGEGCVDQAEFLEIGESDRYVLMFRKPE